MGNSERLKGARAERELAEIFRANGIDAHRGYVYLKQSDVVGLPGIHVECKFVEKLNVRAALRQAEAEAQKRNDGVPVVFSKQSRDGWIVAMRLEDWINLYKKEVRHESKGDGFETLADKEERHHELEGA